MCAACVCCHTHFLRFMLHNGVYAWPVHCSEVCLCLSNIAHTQWKMYTCSSSWSVCMCWSLHVYFPYISHTQCVYAVCVMTFVCRTHNTVNVCSVCVLPRILCVSCYTMVYMRVACGLAVRGCRYDVAHSKTCAHVLGRGLRDFHSWQPGVYASCNVCVWCYTDPLVSVCFFFK